jgi:hypothetical protein
VVLVGERRPEQSHDAVAHHLIDGAFVAMDRFHHPLEHRIEEPPGVFRVSIGQNLERSAEISEEDGDLFALAFDSLAPPENLLREVLWRVAMGA